MKNLVKDYKDFNKYVENSFCLPALEFFYKEWLDSTDEMIDEPNFYLLTEKLEISAAKSIILKRRNGDDKVIDTFHSGYDDNTFLFVEHFKDPTDQNDMIKVGIRYRRELTYDIQPLFFNIYAKNGPRCNFEIDYWNQTMYNITFNSKFYKEKVETYKEYSFNHHI